MEAEALVILDTICGALAKKKLVQFNIRSARLLRTHHLLLTRHRHRQPRASRLPPPATAALTAPTLATATAPRSRPGKSHCNRRRRTNRNCPQPDPPH